MEDILPFPFEKMRPSSIILAFGEERSAIIEKLMSVMADKEVTRGYVSCADNPVYCRNTNVQYCYDDTPFTERVIDEVIESQITHIRSQGGRNRRNGCLMAFNPTVSFPLKTADRELWQGKNLRDIFLKGPRYAITCCLALPRVVAMPPMLRANVDYVFISKMPKDVTENELQRLHALHAPIIESYEVFTKLVQSCTTNAGGCLVIDNVSKREEVTAHVFAGLVPSQRSRE